MEKTFTPPALSTSRRRDQLGACTLDVTATFGVRGYKLCLYFNREYFKT